MGKEGTDSSTKFEKLRSVWMNRTKLSNGHEHFEVLVLKSSIRKDVECFCGIFWPNCMSGFYSLWSCENGSSIGSVVTWLIHLYLASCNSQDYRTHWYAVPVLSVKAILRIIQQAQLSSIVRGIWYGDDVRVCFTLNVVAHRRFSAHLCKLFLRLDCD